MLHQGTAYTVTLIPAPRTGSTASPAVDDHAYKIYAKRSLVRAAWNGTATRPACRFISRLAGQLIRARPARGDRSKKANMNHLMLPPIQLDWSGASKEQTPTTSAAEKARRNESWHPGMIELERPPAPLLPAPNAFPSIQANPNGISYTPRQIF
jgi:hypothetical protein